MRRDPDLISGRHADTGDLTVDSAHERMRLRPRSPIGSGRGRAAGGDRRTPQTGATDHAARSFSERLGFADEDASLARAIEQPDRP